MRGGVATGLVRNICAVPWRGLSKICAAGRWIVWKWGCFRVGTLAAGGWHIQYAEALICAFVLSKTTTAA
jgi:hypothetical protein